MPCRHAVPSCPVLLHVFLIVRPRVGPGHPSFPLVHLLPHLFPLLLFPFFQWLYVFSSFVHPFHFYQNSPTPFPGRGRRRRPNLGLISFFCFCVCNLCYLYSLVKMHCSVFWFTFVCSFSALTLLVGSFDP